MSVRSSHSLESRTGPVNALPRIVSLAAAVLVALGAASPALAAPNYTIQEVLVAEDQFQGERGVTPAPLFKPHETDASARPRYWISSNERGEEQAGEAPDPSASKAGITIFQNGSNRVLAQVLIEGQCLPVVNPDGSAFGCAPPGAEGHPRHPHGIDIDSQRNLAYQVVEHSGLKWNAARTGFEPAATTDEESGLLLVYDVANPEGPRILEAYIVGHGAEESAVNERNGKVYVGNHEPSPTTVPCFVSVIARGSSTPYRFIDLPSENDCVQGIEADEGLNTVNGTTHIGQKMFTFNSVNDTIAYSVDIRGPFEAFIAGLPPEQQFEIPVGFVVHMHDLTTDRTNHRAYQTVHTLASAAAIEGEEAGAEAENEITGRWVAEVDTNPSSPQFKQVRIIDLSNGQSVPAVPSHEDNPEPNFAKRFVHAHFIAVDPVRQALLVTGEHTGNLGVVGTKSRQLEQVIAISRPIPGCVRTPETDPVTGEPLPLAPPEPHVHGVNIQQLAGTAYVSDEGEDCFYESVTILRP